MAWADDSTDFAKRPLVDKHPHWSVRYFLDPDGLLQIVAGQLRKPVDSNLHQEFAVQLAQMDNNIAAQLERSHNN